MILVTGATGNVGHNLVRELINAGEKVRALTRDPATTTLPGSVEIVPGDLTRPETLPAALRDVDRAFLFPVFGALDGFLAAAKEAGTRHIVLLSRRPSPSLSQAGSASSTSPANRPVADSGMSPAAGRLRVCSLSSTTGCATRSARRKAARWIRRLLLTLSP
jgi:uncharacterized protein YbjT (DUF2867 family)